MPEVLDALEDPETETLVWVTGTQMGKTEAIFIVLGHNFTDGAGVDAMYVGPTEKLVRSISKNRIAQLIQSTPILKKRHVGGRFDSVAEKFFPARLGFAHAGSATELASHPCGLICIDELTRMDADVNDEGSPVMLAVARSDNFPDAKILITSTPGLEGACPTWAWFLEGTMEIWRWTCTECGETFIPDQDALSYDKEQKPAEVRLSAGVCCTACGAFYPGESCRNLEGTHYPHRVDNDGRFHVVAERARSSVRSFWTPGLVSPFRAPGKVAERLVRAERLGEESIQGVINTQLGQCYRVAGDAPEWQQVMHAKLAYKPREIPRGVQLITAGVDVSGDRLWWAIFGFGYQSESWCLDYGTTWGDPAQDPVWNTLDAYLDQPLGPAKVQCVFVDSGYKPGTRQNPQNIVYNVARTKAHWFAAKGLKTAQKPLNTSLVDIRGRRTLKTGVELQLVDTTFFKQWVYDRIRLPLDAPYRLHFHADTDEEFARQMTAEEFVPLRTGFQWAKRYANHWFDCAVLAAAAAVKCGLHNLRPLQPQGRKPQRRWIDPG